MPERPVSAVSTCDQWVRGRHASTAVQAAADLPYGDAVAPDLYFAGEGA